MKIQEIHALFREGIFSMQIIVILADIFDGSQMIVQRKTTE